MRFVKALIGVVIAIITVILASGVVGMFTASLIDGEKGIPEVLFGLTIILSISLALLVLAHRLVRESLPHFVWGLLIFTFVLGPILYFAVLMVPSSNANSECKNIALQDYLDGSRKDTVRFNKTSDRGDSIHYEMTDLKINGTEFKVADVNCHLRDGELYQIYMDYGYVTVWYQRDAATGEMKKVS